MRYPAKNASACRHSGYAPNLSDGRNPWVLLSSTIAPVGGIAHGNGRLYPARSECQRTALGHVLPNPASGGHWHLSHHQAAFHSDPPLRTSLPQGLRRHHTLWRQSRQGRYEFLPVARHCDFRTGRHRQPRRRCHSHCHGRSRRHLLDVACRILRHGYDLC